MNSRFALLLIIAAVSVLLAFLLWQYIFNVYEVSFKVSAQNLYADSKSTVRIEAVPLNAFGIRAPFRRSSCAFELLEGKDLVSITQVFPEKGIIVLQAGDKPGKVVLKIKTRYSLWPALIEISVIPALA
ncbi:MAG: hypothetical protein Q8933_06655 [Bacteroidota bacterium]|nr:hypothetical protein [Bacteroidota bacterium]MDP4192919.1 hypothetical protein [Bacteroidota bacterium]MDP4194028.1 hypothetical protein [Bacteroidota bacterium]